MLEEAIKTSNESNWNPITNYQEQRDLLQKWSEKTLERTKFDRDTLNQEKRDNVTDPTSTERPVCGHESTERCVLTLKHVERGSNK